MCFLSITFPNALTHPPPPLYFLTSPLGLILAVLTPFLATTNLLLMEWGFKRFFVFLIVSATACVRVIQRQQWQQLKSPV